MYKDRKNMSKKLKQMRDAKERKRLNSVLSNYPAELPDLRRMVIVIDYDFGKVVEIMKLHKTNRIDCYKAVINGKVWRKRIGWAKAVEGIRKSFTRIHSCY